MIRPIDLDALAVELAAMAVELKLQKAGAAAVTMLQAAGLVDRAADQLADVVNRDGGAS